MAKFETYTNSSCAGKKEPRAKLRVRRNGMIGFGKRTLEALDINIGDRVFFHQDKEVKYNWYIEKTDDKDGFLITVSGKAMIGFFNRFLAYRILESCKVTAQSESFKISTIKTNEKYYALITSPIKEKYESISRNMCYQPTVDNTNLPPHKYSL